MFAVGNCLSLYGFIPFTATFLNFITYGWGAVRICALSKIQQIFIMTHDSIFLGEDGPTHQPIEVLPLLRATPNLLTLRPCDGNEVVGVWIKAIENRKGPSVICLSRQNIVNLDSTSSQLVNFGAYRLIGNQLSQIILLSSGSEVNLCLDVASFLKKDNLDISVISVPCIELFDVQTYSYKNEILPKNALRISIEASSTFGWSKYATYHIGIDSFGVSGSITQISDFFGFTVNKIVKKIMSFI